MSSVDKLESTLESAFKPAPTLPESGKKFFIEWLPWLNLIFGIFSLWAAYTLWQWAHSVNSLVNYVNSLSASYGGTTVVDRMSISVWVSLIVIALEGVIFILAFAPTKARSIKGWNLMFYASLLNLLYGLVLLFTNYGTSGNFIGYAIGTIIGLWILFQVKSAYK